MLGSSFLRIRRKSFWFTSLVFVSTVTVNLVVDGGAVAGAGGTYLSSAMRMCILQTDYCKFE